MNKIEIDEDEISVLLNQAKAMTKYIASDGAILENKSEDIFIRYMSFCRLNFIERTVRHMLELYHMAFRLGHDMGHEFFKTDEMIKNHWDKIKLENNPFFCTAEEKKEWDSRPREMMMPIEHLSPETRNELMKEINRLLAERKGRRNEH